MIISHSYRGRNFVTEIGGRSRPMENVRCDFIVSAVYNYVIITAYCSVIVYLYIYVYTLPDASLVNRLNRSSSSSGVAVRAPII